MVITCWYKINAPFILFFSLSFRGRWQCCSPLASLGCILWWVYGSVTVYFTFYLCVDGSLGRSLHGATKWTFYSYDVILAGVGNRSVCFVSPVLPAWRALRCNHEPRAHKHVFFSLISRLLQRQINNIHNIRLICFFPLILRAPICDTTAVR